MRKSRVSCKDPGKASEWEAPGIIGDNTELPHLLYLKKGFGLWILQEASLASADS